MGGTNELASLACRLGPLGAIGFTDFRDTLEGLNDQDSKLLQAAYVATVDLAAGDAGREIHIIRTALRRLRDELKGNACQSTT